MGNSSPSQLERKCTESIPEPDAEELQIISKIEQMGNEELEKRLKLYMLDEHHSHQNLVKILNREENIRVNEVEAKRNFFNLRILFGDSIDTFIVYTIAEFLVTDNPTIFYFHENILGGEWELVRRVRSGSRWHPATDQLNGFDTYGTYVEDPTSNSTFSIAFNQKDFDEFLFATGDGEKWLVAEKNEVLRWYKDELRNIVASSSNLEPHQAKWYRRRGNREDPWISLIDHHPAIDSGELLYGENRFSYHCHVKDLPLHNGANVFIRKST